MYINLQWLALVPAIYGLYSFIIAMTGVPLLFGTDIEPTIGIAVLVIGLIKVIVAASLSWLIWKAFQRRNDLDS